MRSGGGPGTAAGDDAPLSPTGARQAEALGNVYSKAFATIARGKQLRFYVSPFTRTLQTADPLLSKLGVVAEIVPALMEVGGLTSRKDFARFDAISALMKVRSVRAFVPAIPCMQCVQSSRPDHAA